MDFFHSVFPYRVSAKFELILSHSDRSTDQCFAEQSVHQGIFQVYGFLNIDGIRKNAPKQAELCIKLLNFLAVLVSFSVDFYFCIFHNCLYR